MTDMSMSIPEVTTMEHIIARAKTKIGGRPLRAAVLLPHQPEVFRACRRAIDEGFISPMLIGHGRRIETAHNAADNCLGAVETVSVEFIDEAVQTALGMVRDGTADLLIRGTAPQPEFVHLLSVESEGFVGKGATLGHIAFIKPERYDRLLAITDAVVHPEPDLKQKIALTENLVSACRTVGIERPRVAVLAAVEVVYPQMPVTLEAAILAKMGERGQIKGAFVDGPLSFDCAIDTFAAESKGIRSSEVAGRADAMLAPNMETAHGVYKAMALYGRAKLAGMIYGGRVPIAMPSTSDSVETIYHSIALACLIR